MTNENDSNQNEVRVFRIDGGIVDGMNGVVVTVNLASREASIMAVALDDENGIKQVLPLGLISHLNLSGVKLPQDNSADEIFDLIIRAVDAYISTCRYLRAFGIRIDGFRTHASAIDRYIKKKEAPTDKTQKSRED
jgi:hypothetical protein